MLESIHLKFVATVSKHSKRTVVIVSVLFIFLLCWLDYITGDYSLIIFYLIPVSLTAWFVSKESGVFFCFLAFLARIIADFSLYPAAQRSNLHYWNLCIEFAFLLIMSVLFSALKNRLDSETKLARIDPLTRAVNRRSFFDLAELEVYRAHRYGRPFTIAYIDLDNFKEINDKLGHSTGDSVLVTVANTIKANIRNTDMLARFGGDEFVVLLPETAGESAVSTLEKVHRQLREAMSQHSWQVTFSIGAISYRQPPKNVEEAVRSADTLMYEVKRSGKNRLLHITSG